MKVYFGIIPFLIFLTGCVSAPTFSIKEVEDGEMYAEEQTILVTHDLKEENLSMKLNNRPVENGVTVERNGRYQFTVEGHRWWQSTSKTIEFEIDDRPPSTPEIEAELRDSYYKEVTFGLIKKDHLQYEATINGEPHNLTTAFTEEGRHTLHVEATKDNGLSSKLTADFMIDNRQYTREVVNQFEDMTLNHASQPIPFPHLMKWTEDVKIYIHGKPTNEDRRVLASYIETINEKLPISFSIESQATGNQPRIDLYFIKNTHFSNYGFVGPIVTENEEVVGFAYPTDYTANGALRATNIGVDTQMPQWMRNTTIYHEFMHALGFYNHFEDRPSSILYPYNNNGVTELSQIDEQILELLYREDIKPGMLKYEIEHTLSPRIVSK